MQELFHFVHHQTSKSIQQRRDEFMKEIRKVVLDEYQQQQLSADSDELSFDEQHEGMDIEKTIYSKLTRKERCYRHLFQTGNWMNQIPKNLNQYYVKPVPNMTRVLLKIKSKKLQIIDQSGRTIQSFIIHTNKWDNTLLQGYFKQKTIIISDILFWKKQPICSNQFQFRMAWLVSNFYSYKIKQYISQDINFFISHYYECTSQGFLQALKNSQQENCLIFIHKNSFYLKDINEQVLLWKNKVNNVQTNQGYCKLNKNGMLQTLEKIYLNNESIHQMTKEHGFCRFTFNELKCIKNSITQIKTINIIGLKVIQINKERKRKIDPFSKICFQASSFKERITSQQIYSMLISVMQYN